MKLFFVLLFLFAPALAPALAMAQADSTAPIENIKPLVNVSGKISESRLLVYFWASWCPECREKFSSGALEKLQSEFPKVRFLTVNQDRDEAKGKAFAESEKIPFAVYRDEDKSLVKSIKLFAVPGWAVLNRTGDGHYILQKSSTGAEVKDIRAELTKPSGSPL